MQFHLKPGHWPGLFFFIPLASLARLSAAIDAVPHPRYRPVGPFTVNAEEVG
jgi:hypothetical protein